MMNVDQSHYLDYLRYGAKKQDPIQNLDFGEETQSQYAHTPLFIFSGR
jgi:hypothetical protein